MRIDRPYICACKDKDGKVHLYNKKPYIYGDEWSKTTLLVKYLPKAKIRDDWYDSLRWAKGMEPNVPKSFLKRLFGKKISFIK